MNETLKIRLRDLPKLDDSGLLETQLTSYREQNSLRIPKLNLDASLSRSLSSSGSCIHSSRARNVSTYDFTHRRLKTPRVIKARHDIEPNALIQPKTTRRTKPLPTTFVNKRPVSLNLLLDKFPVN